MDPIIDAQVQSPLYRMLEPVKTQTQSLVYHVPDNLPPVRKTHVEITSDTGGACWSAAKGALAATAPRQKFEFTLPNKGHLVKLVLEYRLTSTDTGLTLSSHTADIFRPHGGFLLTDKVTLNNLKYPIQTLYGRQQFMVTDRMSGDMKTRNMTMGDWHYQNGEPAVHGISTVNEPYSCFMELPYSFMDNPSTSLNTMFVEQLKVVLDISDVTSALNTEQIIGRGNSSTFRSDHTITPYLHAYFLNYHDITEAQIHEANFGANISPTIFGRDVILDNVLATVNSAGHAQFTLTSKQAVYGLSIMVDQSLLNITDISSISVKAGNHVLYQSSGVRSNMVDLFDYSLATWSNRGTASAAGHKTEGTNGAITFDHDGHIYIDFGLAFDRTYNSGCLPLQTLPPLTIELEAYNWKANGTVSSVFEKEYTDAAPVYVYAHHYVLYQIDKDTGDIIRVVDT